MRSLPAWIWFSLMLVALMIGCGLGTTTPEKVVGSPTMPVSPVPTSPTASVPAAIAVPTAPAPMPNLEVSPVPEDRPIAAEVLPQSNQANPAALALQQRGFRILYVGTSTGTSTGANIATSMGATISVEAPRSLWESTFNVTFTEQSQPQMRGIPGSRVTSLQPTPESVQIPTELRSLIADVMFVQPPELF